MARFKNHVLVVIGFAVAGMIGAAFGTGTAQAVVSTLVTAVNTSANPVPTQPVNVTDPGRIPYEGSAAPVCPDPTFCDFTIGIVPAGHRVVIQHISGFAQFSNPPTVIVVHGFADTTIHFFCSSTTHW
jgi:hypothetical protein